MHRKVLQVSWIKPHKAVVIGDDMQLDVLLPRQLGINAILLDIRGGNEEVSVDALACNLNEAVETIIRAFGKS